MTRPIEMPFWVWIGGGPRNHVLGGARIPNWKGHFLGGHSCACTYLLVVDIQLFSIGSSEMRHLATITSTSYLLSFPVVAWFQMLVYLYYAVPFYVMVIYSLLVPGCHAVPDWALIFAGAAAQVRILQSDTGFTCQ